MKDDRDVSTRGALCVLSQGAKIPVSKGRMKRLVAVSA